MVANDYALSYGTIFAQGSHHSIFLPSFKTNRYIYIAPAGEQPLRIRVIGPIGTQMDKGIPRISTDPTESSLLSFGVETDTSPIIKAVIPQNWSLIAGILVVVSSVVLFLSMLTIKLLHNKQVQLQRLVDMDSLTGLASPIKFTADATHLLQTAKPYEYALVSIDIERFGYINNIFGYEIGSQVLKRMSQYFLKQMSPGDLATRFSADIFLFLCKVAPTPTILIHDKAFAEMTSDILGQDISLAFSIGVYHVEKPTDDIVTMIDRVNYARRSTKGNYLNSIAYFTTEMEESLLQQRQILLTMEEAIRNEEFLPYLQPKVNLKTNALAGAEILVRWIKKDGSFLSPGDFIPLFERNGFIKQLDLYMFEYLCKLQRRWREKGISIPRISVNFSRQTLLTEDIFIRVLGIMQQYHPDPSLIEIELTETAFARNTERLITVVEKLKEIGVTISLDDFGTGYSSFHMLHNFDVDVLKIDKGFLEDTLPTSRGIEILSSILSMARNLKMETVAEGVETAEQFSLLAKLGCDMAQGYFYEKPMPASDFEALLLRQSKTKDI